MAYLRNHNGYSYQTKYIIDVTNIHIDYIADISVEINVQATI